MTGARTLITGTGDRAFGFTAPHDCHISGFVVKGTFKDTHVAFDIGGFGSSMTDMEVDNGFQGLACFSFEGGEKMRGNGLKASRSGPVSGNPATASFTHSIRCSRICTPRNAATGRRACG
jgi:hypothetical protein